MNELPQQLSGLIVDEIDIPKTVMSGVYFIVRDGVVIYVGQSEHITARIASHVNKRRCRSGDRIFVFYVAFEWLDIVEGAFIRKFSPKLNGRNAGRMCAPCSSPETDEQAIRFAAGGPQPCTIDAKSKVN